MYLAAIKKELMVIRKFLVFGILLVLIWNCKKDDDGPQVEVVPPRVLSEVAAEDDVTIRAFLSTHFYNYEEFASPPAGFDFKIKIDTIAGDNAGKTPLLDQVASKVVQIPSSRFSGLQEENNVNHTYYYLNAREGAGSSATVADSVLVRYEGHLLDGTQFDASNITAVWFDLGGQVQRPESVNGFAFAMPNFKSGTNPIVFEDGTFTYSDHGVGAIFLPSGLAYYNAASGVIPRYSPLIFMIDLFTYVEDTDHDNDGIPSIMEDLNGNGYLYDDNTDTDLEPFNVFIPNFLDPDDDGDGIPTREEIIINPDGSLTFPDSNGNGIPDYLDKDYPNRF